MSERAIRVQPEQLEEQASNISRKRENYINSYEDIVNKSARLTTTEWAGQDGEDFNAKVKDFKNDLGRMADILQQYVTYLRKAADAYKSAQSEVESKIGTLETKIK